MGSMLPSAALMAVQAGMGMAQQNAAMSAEKDQAKAAVGQIRQAQAVEDRQRRERLRRVLASQRARFGAQGIGSSGSAEAVLTGLAAEADREAADAAAASGLRVNRIDNDLAWSQRRNLLSASAPQNRLAFSLVQRNLSGGSLFDF